MSKFIPVLGTKEQISAQAITEGFTYFETDTGKIFVDVDGERLSFGGGGVKILYSKSDNIKESFLDDTYYIPLADLEDEEAQPSENDLFIADNGKFFKVIEVDYDEGSINCTLVSISSTGGGGTGPSGPGGDSGNIPTAGITLEAIKMVKGPYVYGQKAEIVYKATATDDFIVIYTITVTDSEGNKTSKQESIESGKEFTYDLSPILSKGMNQIQITVAGDNSGSKSLTYKRIDCIEMILKESPDFNPLVSVTGALEFKCMPFGNISKTLKIYVDGEIQPNLTKENLTSSDEEIAITIPPQKHGVHVIKAVLSTGSGALEVSAEPLEYEVAWVEAGNTDPII